MLTVLLAVLAAAINALSSVLQRIANRREAKTDESRATALLHLLRQPVWLLGIGAIVVSFVLQAAALSMGEVSVVQPLMALELPVTLLLASRVFRRSLGGRDWAAIVAMAAGMALFLFSLQPGGGHPGKVGGLGWALGAGLSALTVVVLFVAGQLVGSARGAALFGIGSGVCFALTAVFMSATLAEGLTWSILARWETYLVPVAGIAAMVLLQLGLQAGTLVAVQPGVTLADPVVAILLGVTMFAEQVRGGGWIVLEIAAAAGVAWGTFTLSRSDVASEVGSSGQEPDIGLGEDRRPDGPRSAG
jgi:drug/metabolite transporter (DMT)-like permease